MFDLHCHSTCSDGTYTVKELLELAVQIGLKGLSITDHDTLGAYPEALVLGEQLGLQVIPGVEFSTHDQGKSVHVLGYSFDITSSGLLQLCQRHQARREERNLQILEKLKSKDIHILPEELAVSSSIHTIGRPHIAKLLVDKGVVPDIPTAFQRFIGDGKSCYVQGPTFSTEETIEAIHQAKGLAVLAHPHLQNSRSFVKNLLQYPFDGLECEYAQMPPSQNTFWIKLAKEKNLLMTGGSDFHGSVKPTLKLGASFTSEENFAPFLAHYREMQRCKA